MIIFARCLMLVLLPRLLVRRLKMFVMLMLFKKRRRLMIEIIKQRHSFSVLLCLVVLHLWFRSHSISHRLLIILSVVSLCLRLWVSLVKALEHHLLMLIERHLISIRSFFVSLINLKSLLMNRLHLVLYFLEINLVKCLLILHSRLLH